MIHGYKCFNKGLINRYGRPFEIGKTYHTNGEISFGNVGNGFHMCKRLEDTLRFFDTFTYEVDICEVIGSGVCIEREDDYNGYYDMYACENMQIIKKLTREEIIQYGLNLNTLIVTRFISLFKLTEEEKILFRNKFQNNPTVINYIDYYQDNIKDAFNNKTLKKSKNML